MKATRPLPTLIALIALTIAPYGLTTRLQAQDWRGFAALEVDVEGGRKAVAGATVSLRHLDLPADVGPAPVTTGADGRAAIGGLAAGRWALEVSKEGFMTFRAEVHLAPDAKPEILSASQHNVPGAVGPMRVKVGRARNAPMAQARADAPAPSAATAPPPAAPPPPAVAPAAPAALAEVTEPASAPPSVPPATARSAPPPPAAAAPRPAPPSATAPTPPAPPVASAPTPAAPRAPAPAAAPPAPTPAPAAVRPAPAPPVVAPPASPAPPPSPPVVAAQAPPAPAPAPPVVAAPAPPAAAPAPVAPALPTPPAAARPAAPPTAPIAPAAPPTSAAPTTPTSPAPAAVAPAASPRATSAPGAGTPAVVTVSGQRAEARIDVGAAGCPTDLAARLGLVPLTAFDKVVAALPPGCAVLRVDLPLGASVAEVRLEASAGGAFAVCTPGAECAAGASRFPSAPIVRRGVAGPTVLAIFESTSPAPRTGAMVVAGTAR